MLVGMHPFGPEATRAPHPLYAPLREESPAHEVTLSEGVTGWLITRYDEAKRALDRLPVQLR
jgi:hypothetical protein